MPGFRLEYASLSSYFSLSGLPPTGRGKNNSWYSFCQDLASASHSRLCINHEVIRQGNGSILWLTNHIPCDLVWPPSLLYPFIWHSLLGAAQWWWFHMHLYTCIYIYTVKSLIRHLWVLNLLPQKSDGLALGACNGCLHHETGNGCFKWCTLSCIQGMRVRASSRRVVVLNVAHSHYLLQVMRVRASSRRVVVLNDAHSHYLLQVIRVRASSRRVVVLNPTGAAALTFVVSGAQVHYNFKVINFLISSKTANESSSLSFHLIITYNNNINNN